MRNRFTPLHRVLFAAAALVAGANLSARAQSVGVGTTAPDASAAFEVLSSNKGALLPRVANVTTGITSPATGLIAYQTGSPAGYYYYNGTSWQQIATAAGTATGFIQNQNAADQAASFRISGSGSTLGNFGVGTSAPQLGLDAANGSSSIGLRNNAAWDHMYWFHDGSTGFMRAGGAETGLALQVGASATGTYGDVSQAYRDVMRLLPNGNVGIGTTTPADVLHLQSAAGIRGRAVTSANTFAGWLSKSPASEYFAGVSITGNDYVVFDNIGNSARLTVANGTGNVGIGTTAPSALLDVNGSTRLRGLTTAGLVQTDASGNLSSASTSSFGTSFIQNQNAADQAANFRIAGTGSVGSLQAIGATAAVQTISTQGGYLQWNRTATDGETWLLNQKGSGNTNAGIRFGSATTANAVTEWARFLDNGNFGIGTTAPGQKLEVNGNVFIPSANDYLMRDTNHGMGWYGAGKLWNGVNVDGPVVYGFTGGLLGTNQGGTRTSALSWNAAGNVGIGTTSPTARLHARGTGNAYPATTGTTQSVGLISRFQTSDNAILDLGGNSGNGFWLQSTDITTLALNYPLLLNPNGGNVGIGTTAPAQKLDVVGNIQSSANIAVDYTNANAGTVANTLRFGPTNSGEAIGSKRTATGNQFGLDFYTTSTARMSITSAGNVGVGTTAPFSRLSLGSTVNANAPAGRLAVYEGNTGTNFYGLGLVQNGASNYGMGLWGGTNGLLPYNGAAGTQLPHLYLDQLTANVGIGTITPNYKLEVNGSTGIDANNVLEFGAGVAGKEANAGKIGYGTFTAGALDIVGAGTTNANRRIQFFNEGGAAFDGNVGIGTSSPTSRLHVAGGNLQVDGNAAIGSQGAFLMWNRSGFEGETWLINQFGGGGAQQHGIRFGESTTANVVTEYARFGPTGNFGIGTTNPIAKLHVNGAVAATDVAQNISYFCPGGGFAAGVPQAAGNNGRTLSGYFEGGQFWVNNCIVAGAMNVSSDRRIKHIVGLSDRAADLEMLNKIRVTDYTYIDKLANTDKVVKKVIAQEIQALMPVAVNTSYQAIPNVYEKAARVSFANGRVTVTTAKAHELPAAGGKMRLYTAANVDLNADVTVVDAHTFSFASDKAYEAGLFVYGKFVDDFLSVDYDAIAMLNVSATQELARQVAELKKQNAALQTQVGGLQTKTAQAEADHASLLTLQAQMARLLGETAPANAQARK